MEDVFFDCRSESELERELVVHREGILKKCHCRRPVGDCSIIKKQPNKFDDPKEVHHVLECAANNAQLLLRELGGKCTAPARMRYYPATLELSARLHTDSSCGCPPHCQCALRGSPVTLKLPLELNPANAQIKVNIFRPKPPPSAVTAAGGGGRDVASGTDDGPEDGSDAGRKAGSVPGPEADPDADPEAGRAADPEADTGNERDLEAGIEPASNGGSVGAGDRRGSSGAPSSSQRLTQRRPDVRKSGRRVRWPDA